MPPNPFSLKSKLDLIQGLKMKIPIAGRVEAFKLWYETSQEVSRIATNLAQKNGRQFFLFRMFQFSKKTNRKYFEPKLFRS